MMQRHSLPDVKETQRKLGVLMRRVSGWRTGHNCRLTLETKQSSHLNPKENPDSAFKIDRQLKSLLYQSSDSKMRFFEQIKAGRQAAVVVSALNRLMDSPFGGPISIKRRLRIGASELVQYALIHFGIRCIVITLSRCRDGEFCL